MKIIKLVNFYNIFYDTILFNTQQNTFFNFYMTKNMSIYLKNYFQNNNNNIRILYHLITEIGIRY